MYHNDIQTQVTNSWRRNTNEHPIDQILTDYFNTNNSMKNSQSNIRSNKYKSETKLIIQRQRVIRSFLNKPDENEPSIRKPTTLNTIPKDLLITSIPSPQLLFAELNEQSTNNNNRQQTIKKELDGHSPILIRRQRPTIENLSPIQQMSDISGNQLSITIPPNFTFRNKPSRVFLSDRSSFKIDGPLSSPRLKPLNYSKTISENTLKQNTYIPKTTHQNTFFPTPTWTPRLSDPSSIPTRTLTSGLRLKSHLSKNFINRHQHQLQSEKINTNSKLNHIQDLYISPRAVNNPQHEYEMNKNIHKPRLIIDEWEDLKSNNDGISDEEESISADGNSSTSTCNSQVSVQQYNHTSSLSNQHDLFLSPHSFIDNSKSKIQRLTAKRNISRRRVYNIALPPVTEHLNDEETDMKKIFALQNNDIDDENSLTFQLLNQQETEFEKKISKSTKFQFKQK